MFTSEGLGGEMVDVLAKWTWRVSNYSREYLVYSPYCMCRGIWSKNECQCATREMSKHVIRDSV